MADLLEKRVKSLKSKIEQVKSEIQRLDKQEKAGLFSPLDRMKLNSLHQEQKELQAKLRELLM
jgi:predicted RNase H-like nuclease (RuvC/YqgF family)